MSHLKTRNKKETHYSTFKKNESALGLLICHEIQGYLFIRKNSKVTV